MEKDQIIEHIEGFAIEVHKCLNRLKDIEDESLPNIELGLLEHKVILFYDQLQQLKEQNLAVGKNAEPANEVEAIKAQFESLKTEFSDDLIEESSTEASPTKDEIPEINEEPMPVHEEPEALEPEEAQALDTETDDELNKVLEQAEQLVEEAPPIKWEIESEPARTEDVPLELEGKPDQKATEKVKPKTVTQEVPVEETAPSTQEPEIPTAIEENIDEELSEEKATSLNDRFSAQKTSLHDKLSAQREKQKILSKQLSGKPIRDLKKAINLNMQIRFTKELFENDKRSFKRTVDFINKCNTYSEARSYAHNEVMLKYELSEDNKFYTEFMGLVKRRFI